MRSLAAIFGLAALVLGCGSVQAASPSDLVAQTAANREIVKRFADLFYAQHKVRLAFETYAATTYVQHSPGIADGRDAAIAVLEPMFSRPNFVVHIRRILVDGDMAAVMIHADREGAAGGALVDLFRLKDGKIVEHWDVNERIPVQASNPHPFF